MKLSYVMKFVADMNRAVKFFREVLGLPLKFESPGCSETVTGQTTLALYPAFPGRRLLRLRLGDGSALSR
jgi:lactoylglutathione lyase